MTNKIAKLVLLGLLTAFGPFVTDMYVPSLPLMVGYFHTSVSMVQLGLTASMLGLGIGQLLVGPISDKYGRKRPLMLSMFLFAITSIAIVYSPNIQFFIALRFIQAVAGAGGIVISRSIATDMYEGRELMSMLAVIGAVNGIAPIVAPVIGGMLVTSVGWKGIFVVLLFIGLFLLAGSSRLNESLAVENRKKSSLLATFKLYGVVIRNRQYVMYVLLQASAMAILFAYIGSSPFIVQEHYGFSPMNYSIVFGFNGLVIALGTAASVKLRRVTDAVRVSCTGMIVFGIAEAATLYFDCNFWIYETMLALLLFFMGFTFTAATTLALDSERKQAGTASALFGAMGFVSGGIVSPIVGMGNIMHSTAITIVVCALLAALFASIALRDTKELA